MLVLWQHDTGTTIEKDCMGLREVSQLVEDAYTLNCHPPITKPLFFKDRYIRVLLADNEGSGYEHPHYEKKVISFSYFSR